MWFLVAGVGGWVPKLAAAPHGRCVWLALLLFPFFFIVLAIKYLKVSFYAYFAGREPHYQRERETPSDQLTWPEFTRFACPPLAGKNPICQHFNNHCRRALQQLILWPSTFNCLPKQIIFE